MIATVYPTSHLAGHISALGSKNYTSRYVLAATLANGTSRLVNPATIDDANVMIDCCRHLGAHITATPGELQIVGAGPLRSPGELSVGNAGAVARFLMGVAATLPTPTRFTTPYPASLGQRPHGDLLTALQTLGCPSTSNQGRLPITIQGGLRYGGRVEVSGAVSSQFTSALLFLAPLLIGTSEIVVTGVQRSALIINQTLRVLTDSGINVTASADKRLFRIDGPQPYLPGEHYIPGDWPGAAAILAAAAVTQSDITVTGLDNTDGQGESAILRVLNAMGADITYNHTKKEVRLRGGRPLQAIEFNGDQATDAVLAMVAAAALAQGTSRFYNIENLRYKESDRISDFCRQLQQLGVAVQEQKDAIVIQGSPQGYQGGVSVDGCHDHRLLMALAIIGLRCSQPIHLLGSEHISKSYPDFFTDIGLLGAVVEIKAN